MKILRQPPQIQHPVPSHWNSAHGQACPCDIVNGSIKILIRLPQRMICWLQVTRIRSDKVLWEIYTQLTPFAAIRNGHTAPLKTSFLYHSVPCGSSPILFRPPIIACNTQVSKRHRKAKFHEQLTSGFKWVASVHREFGCVNESITTAELYENTRMYQHNQLGSRVFGAGNIVTINGSALSLL